MDKNIAAAKGVEPCPMCGSDQVRWRKRRPTDFVLTWMRWFAELLASLVGSQSRAQRQRIAARYNVLDYDGYHMRQEQRDHDLAMRAEMVEANTGHKTPRRFWRCEACRREGHVF